MRTVRSNCISPAAWEGQADAVRMAIAVCVAAM